MSLNFIYKNINLNKGRMPRILKTSKLNQIRISYIIVHFFPFKTTNPPNPTTLVVTTQFLRELKLST